MRLVLVLIVLISFGVVFAAEAPEHKQCVEPRLFYQLQQQNAQLLYENAALKLKNLEAQEKAKTDKGSDG
jgi:hypothetical protein